MRTELESKHYTERLDSGESIPTHSIDNGERHNNH